MSELWDDDDDDFVYVDDTPTDADDFASLEAGLVFDDADEIEDDEPSMTPEQVEEAQARFRAKIFDPKPYNIKETKKRLAVVDTETDPFAVGLIVRPFTVGFYDGERHVDFWGDDCVKQFFEYLATLDEDFLIYAHNGGKFDFHFFMDYCDSGQEPLIIGGRMVKTYFGGQEFRDSYAIIPQALSAYKKDEIDYANFTREKRERYRAAILEYQKADCVYTYELIAGFHALYGDKLTIASAALPLLQSYHGFQRMTSDNMDKRFRKYYFGGRNQCFETGVLEPRPGKRWQMVDRNSMYPAEMLHTLHPISADPVIQTSIDDDTDFACIIAKNDGALPQRAEDGSLDFTVKYGEFFATIHEIKAGLETGTLRIDRVKHAWKFGRKARFDTFVTRMYDMRLEARSVSDEVRATLYKFGMNSPYGKFALNPRKFRQWTMTDGELPAPLKSAEHPNGWALHSSAGNIYIWSRPSPRRKGFINVATAASITGAARANLLRNLALAVRPIYCDTDSIICEEYRGETDDKLLGAWALEKEGDICAIAGKKLYCLFDKGEAKKKASKGVNLTPAEILSVCNGNEVIYESPVPLFKFGKSIDNMTSKDFLSRRVNKTGKV